MEENLKLSAVQSGLGDNCTMAWSRRGGCGSGRSCKGRKFVLGVCCSEAGLVLH